MTKVGKILQACKALSSDIVWEVKEKFNMNKEEERFLFNFLIPKLLKIAELSELPSTKHKENCEFEKNIKELEKGYFTIGEGETSGIITFGLDGIHIYDGWNSYPSIDFKYCPDCGIKIRKEK